MIDEQFTVEELILRDHLALDRTRLANERTLLAYLRTALMLIVAGATAVKFVGETHSVIITGWVFIALGAFVALIGTWRFLTMRRDINARRAPPRHP
jgi:putative membrane protein